MATSKLQREVGRLLDKELPEYTIRENHRPDWLMSPNLTKMELDFYIEELKIAFEIQGAQHYQFVEYFHKTRGNFEKSKTYDRQKKDLCYGAGVTLVEVFTVTDAIVVIKGIQEKYGKEPAPYYFEGDGYKAIDIDEYYRERQKKNSERSNLAILEKQRAQQREQRREQSKREEKERAVSWLERIIQNKTRTMKENPDATSRAMLELDRWEKKSIACGKVCRWHPVDLPADIARDIAGGIITFRQARAKLS